MHSSRNGRLERMDHMFDENKQIILDHLQHALACTNELVDLKELRYVQHAGYGNKQQVIAIFDDGMRAVFNVTGLSGFGTILNVMDHLSQF